MIGILVKLQRKFAEDVRGDKDPNWKILYLAMTTECGNFSSFSERVVFSFFNFGIILYINFS